MIPKTIHYCWFGRGPLPDIAEKCIESWKNVLSDYEIVRWDEDSFDINSNSYVREAYESRKFAFVSDYVRLYALYTQGGVYMDTDVEVLKSLDGYLFHEAFSGFENVYSIPTGIMACEKGFKGFGELLRWYDKKHFLLSDGSMDTTTNVETITNYYLKRGLKRDNSFQVVEGFALYPNIVFCPYKHEIGSRCFSRTVTIHHKYGSWIPPEERKRYKGGYGWQAKEALKRSLLNILGKRIFDRVLLAKYHLLNRGQR